VIQAAFCARASSLSMALAGFSILIVVALSCAPAAATTIEICELDCGHLFDCHVLCAPSPSPPDQPCAVSFLIDSRMLSLSGVEPRDYRVTINGDGELDQAIKLPDEEAPLCDSGL